MYTKLHASSSGTERTGSNITLLLELKQYLECCKGYLVIFSKLDKMWLINFFKMIKPLSHSFQE